RQRGLEMKTKLFAAVQSYQRRKREEAAGLFRKARAAPDLSPGIASNKILKRLVKLSAVLKRAFDVRVAKNRAASLQAFLVAFAFVHLPGLRSETGQFLRNERTASFNPAGSSTLEMCDVLSST